MVAQRLLCWVIANIAFSTDPDGSALRSSGRWSALARERRRQALASMGAHEQEMRTRSVSSTRYGSVESAREGALIENLLCD